jgi:hypothetical protein
MDATLSKKVLIGGGILLVIVAVLIGGFYMWSFLLDESGPEVGSQKFIGKVDKVEGNVIYMTGTFEVDGEKYPGAPHNAHLQQFQVAVQVTDETQLNKTIKYLPGVKNPIPGKVYRYSSTDVRTETGVGTINDFTDEIGAVTVFAGGDIYGKETFKASSIEYQLTLYSQVQ